MLDGQIGICAAANVRPSRDGSSFDVYPTHGTYRGSEHKYGESLFTRVTVKQIGILQTELTTRVDIL